jgi:ribosomal protein L18E
VADADDKAAWRKGLSEVLFELRRQGRFVRVSAIDPATNTEVVVVGPSAAGDLALRQSAARKLARVVAQKSRSPTRSN